MLLGTLASLLAFLLVAPLRPDTVAAASPFPPPRGIASPVAITAGPDGNLWFTNAGTRALGRITTTGEATIFEHLAHTPLDGIATGSDGNLWFTMYSDDAIGRMSPTGSVTEFVGSGISVPLGIAAGPDGNLWFANGGGSIGRITPAGAVTLFPIPGGGHATEIAPGPDGNLWFAMYQVGIGRITPTGTVTVFTGAGIYDPLGITGGPDGNVWFTNDGDGSIGRITPAGVVTAFPAAPAGEPYWITAGADGNLWFTRPHTIGRITPTGVVSAFAVPSVGNPEQITAGPDGNVWFTVRSGEAIGRVTPTGVVTLFTQAVDGPPADVPPTSPFYADIDWFMTRGVVSGYADGLFHPVEPVSRQAVAAFLYRLAGSPSGQHPVCSAAPFIDVAVGAPFCGEIAWLAGQQIAGGHPDGTFRPAAPVSRQAIAAFLYRYAARPLGEHPPCPGTLSDVPVGAPFCGEIAWLVSTHVATGYPDGSFRPAIPSSRQAAAAFLHRLDGVLHP